MIEENNLDLKGAEIIDPKSEDEVSRRQKFGEIFFEKRKRKGVTEYEARQLMRERNYFGCMLVETGEADALVSGITRNYKDVIRPALHIIGTRDEIDRVAGMYIMMTKRGPIFLADTTVNVNPTAEEIAELTVLVASKIRRLKIQPRIALLSYSNFGSAKGEVPEKMRKAVEILHEEHPSLVVDGEVQANFALSNELMLEKFAFSHLANRKVNTLIFPNLSSGNIAYKILQEMAESEAIGPVLLGLKKSVHVLQLGSSVREIVNMIKIAVIDAQHKK